jgi:23S rRNA pseudouridine1911/1915/1917 synthase
MGFLGCAILLFLPTLFQQRNYLQPPKGQEYDFVTTADHTKERLDVYLSTEFEQYSRSFLSGLCEKGKVMVNGKIEGKSYKMGNGDNVHVDIEIKLDKSVVNPEYIPLDILYEDEHIIAINKPNGMVVHPAPGSPNGTFVNALLYHLGADSQKLLDALKTNPQGSDVGNDLDDDNDFDLPETPEAAQASPQYLRPGIVHRLDKGTSGVLLAAKHPEAVTKMCALFAKRNIQKIYLAVCIGHPGETTIVEPIGRCRKNRQVEQCIK